METSRETKTDWTREETVFQTTGKPTFVPQICNPSYNPTFFQSDIAKEHREQRETEKRSKMDSRQIAKSDAKKVKKQAQKEKKDMPKRRELE